MTLVNPLLALAQSSEFWRDLVETFRTSPAVVWVGGAILVLLCLLLLKAVAKTIIKWALCALIFAIAFLGWDSWQNPPDRSLTDIQQQWLEAIQESDFSRESVQALVSQSKDFVGETLHISQTKSRHAANEALATMSEALERKIREAAATGRSDAREQMEQLRQEIQKLAAELRQAGD